MSESMGAIEDKQKEFPLLAAGELHLWQASTIISPSAFEKCNNVLSEQELAKVPFFKFKQVRDSYIVSQGTLRIIISGYLGIPPEKVELGRRSKGKPYSMDDPGLYFNMSNSGNIVVIAFSRDSEVGIDIEKIRSLPDLDDMIRSNFTTSEIKFITNRTEGKINRFFRFWTLKESYLKATGEGMRLRPDNIEFTIENEKIRQLSIKGVFEQEDWKFKEFSIGTDYVGTISYAMENTRIRHLQYF